MNSTSVGRSAESKVVELMNQKGYHILARNWQRPNCEIDIVAKKAGIIYFAEVKFRSSDGQGSGLEYITRAKISRMMFSANSWCSENDWDGDWRLLAASVARQSGDYVVEAMLELT